MKKLSVVISNRNDVSMLAVTFRSCVEELKPLGLENCEIIIVDNSDPEWYDKIKSVLPSGYISDGLLKVYRQDYPCLFTARETAIEHSTGKYIACVDSHMLIGNDMFLDLYNFMESKQDDPTIGFAHAPINWAHQHETSSRHDRDMSECELGNWNKSYDSVRTITWKGMPWICRRELWKTINGYGALAEHRLSWGGGDMHIGIKPWMLGYKNYAVPTSPGIHIGPFPKVDTTTNPNAVKVAKVTARDRYRLWSVSGEGPHSLGFLISCYVIGGESMMKRNKASIKRRFGQFIDIDKWWNVAIQMGQKEKIWLDAHKTITFDELLTAQPWNS